MDLIKKWASRKLLVAVLGVVAIAWGTQFGEGTEAQVITTGTIVINSVIALLSAVYIIVQGKIDGNGS